GRIEPTEFSSSDQQRKWFLVCPPGRNQPSNILRTSCVPQKADHFDQDCVVVQYKQSLNQVITTLEAPCIVHPVAAKFQLNLSIAIVAAQIFLGSQRAIPCRLLSR